jgi:hypothetical protein
MKITEITATEVDENGNKSRKNQYITDNGNKKDTLIIEN